MSKFNNLLSIELQKVFKTKLIYIIIIIMLLLSLIMVGMYEIINAIELPNSGGTFQTAQDGYDYYDGMIKEGEAGIAGGTIKDPYYVNQMGRLKRGREYYGYLIKHNMSISEAQPYAVGSMGSNYIDFTRLVSSIALTMAIIVVVVVGARNMAGEMSTGAMKMVLIRPVSRPKVLSAKMLAAFISGLAVYVMFTVLAGIYGMMRFGLSALPSIMVTESSAALIPAVGVIGLELLQGLFKLMAFALLTFSVATVTKSRSAAGILPLVLLLGSSLLTLLQFVFIGYVEFSFNINFLSSLQVYAGMFKGISVYSMVACSVVWITILAILPYWKFRKYTV